MTSENRLLLVAGVLYTILAIFFWPSIHTTMDESAYLVAAYALRHGTFYPDMAGVSAVMSYPIGGHIVTQYPPGMAFLLAGFSLAGWGMVFALNLVVHLLTFWTVIRILRRLSISPVYAILYLFYPTAVIYSRTVMSDMIASLLVAQAFYAYLGNRRLLVGVLIGIAILIRTASGLLLLPFLVDALIQPLIAVTDGRSSLSPKEPARWWEGIRSAFLVGIGTVPFAVLAWVYQAIVQGGGWARYASVPMGLSIFPQMFPGYLLGLMLIYPAMFLAPLLYRGEGRWLLSGLCYLDVVFFSCYAFQDAGGSWIESLLLGLRYMLSVIPLFIVAYGHLLERVWGRVPERIRFAGQVAVCAILFFGAAAIEQKHQSYLKRSTEVRNQIAAIVSPGDDLVCTTQLAKLLNPGWTGARQFFLGDGYPTVAQDAEVVEQHVDESLKNGKNVVLARWSRKYRPETKMEDELFRLLKERYETVPLVPTGSDSGFDELDIWKVVGSRKDRNGQVSESPFPSQKRNLSEETKARESDTVAQGSGTR